MISRFLFKLFLTILVALADLFIICVCSLSVCLELLKLEYDKGWAILLSSIVGLLVLLFIVYGYKIRHFLKEEGVTKK